MRRQCLALTPGNSSPPEFRSLVFALRICEGSGGASHPICILDEKKEDMGGKGGAKRKNSLQRALQEAPLNGFPYFTLLYFSRHACLTDMAECPVCMEFQ